jgi:recombination protein RecT
VNVTTNPRSAQRPPDTESLIKPGTTIAQALPKTNALDGLIRAYGDDLSAVMPSHTNPESFFGLAIAYIRRDPYLSKAAAANPMSLIIALREIAAWGHMPMRGTAALVPFASKKDGHNGFQITAIEEVGGVLQRIHRAGGVTAVHAEVVREKDFAKFNRTKMILPDHDYDEFADPTERGALKAVYAWATMLSGNPSTVVWMPKGVVLKHRAVSKSGDNFWGPPWPAEGPWTEDMWKKTALHKLSTLIPSSVEYRWQLAAAEAAAAGQTRFPDKPVTPEAGGDYIDGDYTEADPNTEWPAAATPGGQQQ